MNKITITATSKEAIIEVQYNGTTYTQKTIPTNSGAKTEGCSFHDQTDLPDCIIDEVSGFTAYNLMRALQK